ncbi:MAG: methyltransferase domain-containing protein [Acidobacteriota bacterium]
MDAIAKHYGVADLMGRIREALAKAGKDAARPNLEDLAPVDEFHIRGREATLELAALAGVKPGLRVLDVGSGLGGSSRFLAGECGCEVAGIDLTPEYCEVARELTAMTELQERAWFVCGSALDLPFRDAAFELAWTQHVQMNIGDKAVLYAEVLRVLKPGGRFAFHDILAGPGGPVHVPVPWAEEAGMSFLIDADGLRDLLERTGFRVVEWRDTTEVARNWFEAALEKQKQMEGPPPVGLHLLLRETGKAKMGNVARNLAEGRIEVYQGVVERGD